MRGIEANIGERVGDPKRAIPIEWQWGLKQILGPYQEEGQRRTQDGCLEDH